MPIAYEELDIWPLLEKAPFVVWASVLFSCFCCWFNKRSGLFPLLELIGKFIFIRDFPLFDALVATYSPNVYVGCNLWWFWRLVSFGLPGSESLCMFEFIDYVVSGYNLSLEWFWSVECMFCPWECSYADIVGFTPTASIYNIVSSTWLIYS